MREKAPFAARIVLTGNYEAFTDRLQAKNQGPSGEHSFDKLCAESGIDHRLAPVRHPQTNGMVERFNGRISGVLATHRFERRQDLEQTLKRYCHLYNHYIPQRALRHQTPVQTLKQWQTVKPDLFIRKAVIIRDLTVR